MGKKGTKRKTRWRTLSIGEAASEDEASLKKFNGVDYANGGVRSSSYSGYQGKNPRNGYARASYGHAAAGRTFSSQSTPTRRNGAGGGYLPGHYQYPRNTERSHSSAGPDEPKIKFNEDEYTRITTPRQDVLFKKGYLSKRKPLIASTSTSSADPGASTSAPSTPSTQSTSPEHHAHTNETTHESELVMPDGLMYPNGFYDQNGVFYVNVPNYDGYGHLMMYPYNPYPPYGHIEYFNQVCMQHPYSNNASYAESQVSDTNETSPHDEEAASQSSPEDSTGQASTKDTGDSEGAQQSLDGSISSVNNSNGQEQEIAVHNEVIEGPHYIYPGYMFGSQMYHVNGMNIQCANGMTLGGPMDVSNKQKLKKKRRRKQRKPSGCNGTNATNSEDEFSSDSETPNDSMERTSYLSNTLSNNGVQENWEPESTTKEEIDPLPNVPVPCDPSKSSLNTNCSEFIPKAYLLAKNSQLKTDVQEFVPKSYQIQQVMIENPVIQCLETEATSTSEVEVQEIACVQIENSKDEDKPVVEKNTAPVQKLDAEHKPVIEHKPAINRKHSPGYKPSPVSKQSPTYKQKSPMHKISPVHKPVNTTSNGHPHKDQENHMKEITQPNIEPVRKVQIVCKEKPSPISCSAPRTDQWTTVKNSRSKNKKNRQDVSSASPSSPVSDVASENTFRMFIEGNITPPPSEEDGSLENGKQEENAYFTSDDTGNNEEQCTEETISKSNKENNKISKSKSKKNKKSKETRNKSNSDICNDDKRTRGRTMNGKTSKMTKQVDLESVKSNLAQLLGPTNTTELDITKIQLRDRMNGIGIEELKELYIELPELKDQHLENLLQSTDDYDYAVSTLSVTDNPKKFLETEILPQTLNEIDINVSKENELNLALSCVPNEVSPITSDSEDLLTVADNKEIQKDLDKQNVIENKSETISLDNTSNHIEVSEDLESTLNSIADITADSEFIVEHGVIDEIIGDEVLENQTIENELLDEGVILPELKDQDANNLPITETVRRWLTEQKEKSPEPVLREPNDPALAILLNQGELDASGSSDAETDEEPQSNPKNSRGNPLRASSVDNNKTRSKRSRSTPPSLRRGETGDTDSDYLSDIQDDARKRVAGITSEPDLLDCWEPDVLPFNALPHLIKVKAEDAEEIEQYESVYGKSVDYNKLSASLGANKTVLPPFSGEGVVPPCNGICCSVM
uniref:Putative mediator of rna polymerase ii transcription subunit 26 isoform x2 n=1 Tax=Xenopsylla cheopis TaxID=163159 RepID=A0A6M2DI84_XENCH